MLRINMMNIFLKSSCLKGTLFKDRDRLKSKNESRFHLLINEKIFQTIEKIQTQAP